MILKLQELISPLLTQAAYNHPDRYKSMALLVSEYNSSVGLQVLRLDRIGRLLQHELQDNIDSMPVWEVIWHQAMCCYVL